jgi:large subunit ribosomal protein L15
LTFETGEKMTVRKRKRKNRYRGHRTHGAGNTKNRRGAGNRGGRGRAGSHKHKFNLYAGTFGTERPRLLPQSVTKAINIDFIVQSLPKWIAEKKAEKTGEGIIIDGQKIGFDKILGKTNVLKEKLVIKNLKTSKKASERILAAGGKIENAEETTGENEGKEEEEFAEEEEEAGEKE